MKVKRIVINTLKSLILPVFVYFLFFSLSGGRFGNAGSMFAVLRQVAYPAIIAWAICNNQTMGVWDFTPGSIIVLSGIVGGNLAMNWNLGVWGMVVLVTLVCVICTLLTCTVFTYCRIPSMVTGLGMLMIFESLGAYLFNGGGVVADREWTFFAKSPYVFIVLILCFAAIYFINNRTKFGFDVRSLGYGTVIAQNIGVDLVKTRYKAFFLEGVLLGVASIINIGMQGSVKPQTAMATTSVAFSAIMAVMVGTYLSKYCDLLVGTMLGALTLKMLASGMLGCGLRSEAQQIGNGVFLVLFLAISHNQNKLFEMRDRRRKRREIMAKA